MTLLALLLWLFLLWKHKFSYLCSSFFKSFNDFLSTNFEPERLVSISGGIKLLSILQHSCQSNINISCSCQAIGRCLPESKQNGQVYYKGDWERDKLKPSLTDQLTEGQTGIKRELRSQDSVSHPWKLKVIWTSTPRVLQSVHTTSACQGWENWPKEFWRLQVEKAGRIYSSSSRSCLQYSQKYWYLSTFPLIYKNMSPIHQNQSICSVD